ncbi:MAG: hypothetical protein JO043_05060 [Candidatus Eremiobacteraeota bacterium]|nr:hypothetical protein [Candidatus Eremiobacteraeota bacterium]
MQPATVPQVRYDLCRAAYMYWYMHNSTPSADQSGNPKGVTYEFPTQMDSEDTFLHRMRLIAQEAHLIKTCSDQHSKSEDTDPSDSRQSSSFYTFHHWGCGPYTNFAPTLVGQPTSATWFGCIIPAHRGDDMWCAGLMKKPELAVAGTHPPINHVEMLYDIVAAAHSLDGKAEIATTGSSDLESILFELAAAAELDQKCFGAVPSPPSEMSPDYARDRIYACY